MITRGSGEIDWYSYDLPSKIDALSDSSYAEFWYGPGRSRINHFHRDHQGSVVKVRNASGTVDQALAFDA